MVLPVGGPLPTGPGVLGLGAGTCHRQKDKEAENQKLRALGGRKGSQKGERTSGDEREIERGRETADNVGAARPRSLRSA